jgi:heterodisulfide reductase subunit A-like polyferredoxin
MENAFLHSFVVLYQIWQWLIDKLLSPTPPPPHTNVRRPKIAVIGAGLTGVSSAAHCIGHGFDVRIFEAGPRENLGGIWSVSNHGEFSYKMLLLITLYIARK